MKRNILSLIALAILLFAFSECTFARLPDELCNSHSVVPENTTVIPIELVGHKIFVRVQINDNSKEYAFILDTGALTMIDEKVAEELQLEKGVEIHTLDPSVKSYLTNLNTLRLGEMKVENMSIPIMNTGSVFGDPFKADGFVGPDFLKFFRFTIDYREKHILYYEIADFSDATLVGHRIHFDRHFIIGVPMVECTINGEIQIKGIIDTGSPFGLVLPLSFVERIDSSPKIKSKGVIAKWPFTSSEYNYLSRIEHLTFGTLELRNIPILFAELPANLPHPLIGKEILSQFLVTLDYPANELILSPYDDAQFKDNLFSTGLSVKKGKEDRAVIRGLWEGSPADKAHIEIGNEILEINSKLIKDLSVEEIDKMLNDDSVKEISLVVVSGKIERNVILKKETLLPNVND